MKIMEELMNVMMCMALLLTAYAFSKNHVMNNLIMIEFMLITLLTVMFMAMNMMKMENYLILYFIVMAISESMVGMSLMIAMIRTHSNDFIKSINIMKF